MEGATAHESLRTTGLDSYQCSNNTRILFATQYENDNAAFHRSSTVSNGLASGRTFCQWKIKHQLRKYCVKGMILRKMVGREKDAAMQAV